MRSTPRRVAESHHLAGGRTRVRSPNRSAQVFVRDSQKGQLNSDFLLSLTTTYLAKVLIKIKCWHSYHICLNHGSYHHTYNCLWFERKCLPEILSINKIYRIKNNLAGSINRCLYWSKTIYIFAKQYLYYRTLAYVVLRFPLVQHSVFDCLLRCIAWNRRVSVCLHLLQFQRSELILAVDVRLRVNPRRRRAADTFSSHNPPTRRCSCPAFLYFVILVRQV